MLFVKGKGGLIRYVPINESIRITLTDILKETPIGQKLFVKQEDKTHLAMKRLQCFIAYHRKEFTENKIAFHGLRHTFATIFDDVLFLLLNHKNYFLFLYNLPQ